MRVEPEYKPCFHYCTSGTCNQEPLPPHLLHDDSVPHDPAVIAYRSTSSSPVHSSSPPIQTGKLTNQNQNRNTTSVNTFTAPTQPLNPASSDFTAFSRYKPPRSGSKFGNGVGFARSDFSRPDHMYHDYAPTQYEREMMEMIASLAPSNAHRNKSHEKSRWEDYKQGDKGGWFPPLGSRPNATSSRSFIDNPYRRDYNQGDKGGLRPNTAISSPGDGSRPAGPRQGSMSGFGSFPAGQTNAPYTGLAPTLFPGSSSSPYSTTVPAPASSSVQRPHETGFGSSSTSGYRTASAAATTTTNLASQGTTPSTHDYPTLLDTNLAAQGITQGLQANPTMSGSNTNAQGTTTPAFQAYPVMFGPTLGAQGTTPSLQAYPIMFGTNPAAQGTNPGAEGTNLGAQGATPAVPAYYPVHGYILLPFAAMNLQ